MENNEVDKIYAEEEYEEGLTFAKIGYFFKKGWITMLICVVAAALLTCAVILPIKFYYKSEPMAKAAIEYIYDGIERGEDPNGGILDTDNIISTSILSEAVEAENLGDVITDIAKLRARMRVEGVLTEEYVKLVADAAAGDQSAINTLRTYTMYPTQFEIILSEPQSLGLSDSQAVKLVERVIKVYYTSFNERFSVTNMFDESIYDLSENSYIEFTDIYDEYMASFTPMADYLAELASRAPKFTSTKYSSTFTGLSSELGRLRSNFESFNTSLLTNKVWRNKATAAAALEENKLHITSELENVNKYIDELKTLIAGIQPNKIVSDANGVHSETTSYPKEYYEYQDRLDTYNLRVLEYNNQLSNIDRRIANLAPDTVTSQADIDKATAELKALEAQATTLVQKINNTVTDYYDTTFISQSVRTVRAPIMSRKSSDINVVIALAAAAVVGFAISCIITGVRIQKRKAIRAAKAKDKDVPQDAAK